MLLQKQYRCGFEEGYGNKNKDDKIEDAKRWENASACCIYGRKFPEIGKMATDPFNCTCTRRCARRINVIYHHSVGGEKKVEFDIAFLD